MYTDNLARVSIPKDTSTIRKTRESRIPGDTNLRLRRPVRPPSRNPGQSLIAGGLLCRLLEELYVAALMST